MNAVQRSATNRSRTAPLAILLVGLALTAGACGDGGGSNGPSPTQTPTASPTPPPTQVAGAGLVSEILGGGVASDPAGQVSVTFTVTDENGIPLTATTSSAQSDQEARTR